MGLNRLDAFLGGLELRAKRHGVAEGRESLPVTEEVQEGICDALVPLCEDLVDAGLGD